jgi:hypothetical protein
MCNTNKNEECHLLRCYAKWLLLRTDVFEECITSIIMVTRTGELGMLAVILWHEGVQEFWLMIRFVELSKQLLTTLYKWLSQSCSNQSSESVFTVMIVSSIHQQTITSLRYLELTQPQLPASNFSQLQLSNNCLPTDPLSNSTHSPDWLTDSLTNWLTWLLGSHQLPTLVTSQNVLWHGPCRTFHLKQLFYCCMPSKWHICKALSLQHLCLLTSQFWLSADIQYAKF